LLFSLLVLIYICEKDDNLITKEGYLKTVALADAKSFLRQSQDEKNSTPEGNFITSISDEINYEDLTNTDEELAVIDVKTKYKNLQSKVVLLNINNELQSVVVGLNPFEHSTETSFSGEMLITSINGNIIKAFEIEDNVFVAEYINNNTVHKNHEPNKNKNSVNETAKNCWCGMSNCNWCGELDEVIITSGGSPSPPSPYVSIAHMYPTGGGGGLPNEWDFGGGGGHNGTHNPDNPEPEENPCDKINELESDRAFKRRLLDLEENLSLDYETGFLINHNDVPYDPIAGSPNTDEINFNVSGTIDGYLHSHVLPNGNSIFSPDDIEALYLLYNNGHINNTGTFVISVVTGHGTSYSIIIDDVNAFNTFSQNNLIGDNFSSFSIGYSAQSDLLENLYGIDFVSANEIAMLQALENSGLSLLKGNSDYSDWQKIKAQGRQTVDVGCN
jgi:hypothetical protein